MKRNLLTLFEVDWNQSLKMYLLFLGQIRQDYFYHREIPKCQDHYSLSYSLFLSMFS